MKCFVVLFLAFLNFGQAYAAIKSCEELEYEISAKLDAAGVQSYVLIIVGNEKIENKDGTSAVGEVVGSCDGGRKKIIYIKKQAPAKPRTSSEMLSPI
ncbi:MAG: DUF1161 domain-containing protein [Candidatus Electrothrix sp. AR4]|nr:DUF1161 domain-containing protein [Candidatus Electrothrix sp. AR4]